jgi:hypothetical protein
MTRSLLLSLVAGAVLALGHSSVSVAADCSCLTKRGQGVVTLADGQVLVTQNARTTAAVPGSSVFPGARISTGANSSAGVRIGRCEISVPPVSELTIEEQGPQLCLALSSAEPAPVLGGGGVGPAVVFGGVLAAVAIGVAVSNSDDNNNQPVSP